MTIRHTHNMPLLPLVRSTSELLTTFVLKDGSRRARHESGVLRRSIRVSNALPLSRHHVDWRWASLDFVDEAIHRRLCGKFALSVPVDGYVVHSPMTAPRRLRSIPTRSDASDLLLWTESVDWCFEA